MLNNVKEFCDPLESVCAPAQQESKIVEQASAYNSFDMDNIARIDEPEIERRKCKTCHRNVLRYRACESKSSYSNGNIPF